MVPRRYSFHAADAVLLANPGTDSYTLTQCAHGSHESVAMMRHTFVGQQQHAVIRSETG
jgi:hypothetical protein